MLKYLPSTKWFAQGAAGLITWGILTALGHFGVVIPAEQQIPIIGLVSLVLHYAVPASFQDKLAVVNDDVVAAGVAIGKLTPPAVAAAQVAGPPQDIRPPAAKTG